MTSSPATRPKTMKYRIMNILKITIRLVIVLTFVISMIFIHQVIPSITVALSLYATNTCGFILRFVLKSKSFEISKTLNQLTKLSNTLNPNDIIGNKYVRRYLTLFFISVITLLLPMSIIFFFQEWENYKRTFTFPFYIPPEFQATSLAVVLVSIMFSVISGGAVCGIAMLLCDSTYITTSNIIKTYRESLIKKLKTQNLSSFIFNDMKVLKTIVTLVEAIDKALNACALLNYCIFTCLIFITISVALSKENIFRTEVVICFIAINFIISVNMFYMVTMSGSGVYEEGEKLKKIGFECAGEVFVLNEKDESFLALFLLLDNIKEVNLKMTGGGMFVIERTVFLTMTNAVVTYGVILFQLSVDKSISPVVLELQKTIAYHMDGLNDDHLAEQIDNCDKTQLILHYPCDGSD
ncbi:uncharacterized protein NPIL_493441 [Nephila pilipes]|uniref:Uncharacterized protein n=1 Tax=Nephila pilipes TaxID=299642 RepID=A0A8X6QXD3_NEPPI|nr:uncharacterized protein NPIL_493441 [Nephila pilipes]